MHDFGEFEVAENSYKYIISTRKMNCRYNASSLCSGFKLPVESRVLGAVQRTSVARRKLRNLIYARHQLLGASEAEATSPSMQPETVSALHQFACE